MVEQVHNKEHRILVHYCHLIERHIIIVHMQGIVLLVLKEYGSTKGTLGGHYSIGLQNLLS